MNDQSTGKMISLLRHAKSDWANSKLDDHDRPLNARGRRSAPLIAKYATDHNISFDVILVSTAVRAQQTLDLLIETWETRPPAIFSTQNLYLAPPKAILSELGKLEDQWRSALVIAHNPGLGDLAILLAGEQLDFPTACLVTFALPINSWDELENGQIPKGRMVHYCKPRELE
jgi:phosphohistidine phosphatase